MRNKGLAVFSGLVYAFLLFPLVIITFVSFGKDSYLKFPPSGFSLHWVANIFKVEMFTKTLIVSSEVAALGTLIAFLAGLPAAYGLSRYEFKGKNLLKGLFMSPVLVPGIVLGFSLIKLLIVQWGMPVLPSLLLGHTVIILPYIIRVISSSLDNLDYSIEECAVSLGANRVKTFFLVVLPNITSGMIASFILAFINSFNNVPVSVFLTGPGVSTLPIQMMSYVEYNYDPTIAALSVVLMAMTVVLMVIVEKTLGLNISVK